MGVHHRGPGQAHRLGHFAGAETAAQQTRGRARRADLGGVARKQLRRLPHPLADDCEQLLDHALLAAGGAIAVVQEEDHALTEPIRARRPIGWLGSDDRADPYNFSANLDCCGHALRVEPIPDSAPRARVALRVDRGAHTGALGISESGARLDRAAGVRGRRGGGRG